MPTTGIFNKISNASSADLQKLESVLNYAGQNSQGQSLIHDIGVQRADLVINHSGINQTVQGPDGHVTINWDPSTAIEVVDANGKVTNYESPASNLLHEMAHAADPYLAIDVNVKDAQYDSLADKIAIERTNSIIVPLGEEARTNHSGDYVTVNNPTEHTANGLWVEVGSDGQVKSSTQPDGFNDNWGDSGSPPSDPGDPPGGGGSGGGGCVSVDSLLPGGQTAGEIRVGDTMELADERTLEGGTGAVSYSQKKLVPGFRITTESGVTLKCSDTAPIPTPEGLVLAPELLHKKVPVRRDEDGVISVAWEKVTSVESIGEIYVQHITVGDRCFWAGEKAGAYILHHNLKDSGGDDPEEPEDPWDDFQATLPVEQRSVLPAHAPAAPHAAHTDVIVVGIAHSEMHHILL
ncbi:hypothetical protein GTP81_06490 [Rugamonas sp. FT107W]|uniref:Uncharacterized protein n=1 Tax=Duganella vulcania TaxID=2692166 RepID=A0A845HDP7_9BURK|nr:M91 family zinc metallopeptidase [Duganella vulcania]MYN16397.1 hypothetical protein [Duganella vulcania]